MPPPGCIAPSRTSPTGGTSADGSCFPTLRSAARSGGTRRRWHPARSTRPRSSPGTRRSPCPAACCAPSSSGRRPTCRCLTDAGGLTLREDQPVGRGVDDDRVAVTEVALEQLQRDRVRDLTLQHPLQRTGPEVGVIADAGDVRPGLVSPHLAGVPLL